MKSYDVAIIGAGSIGVPLSYYLGTKGLKVAVFEQHTSVGRGQNRAAIGGIRATHSDPAKIRICQRTLDIISRMQAEHGFDVDWISGGYLFPVYTTEHEKALYELLDYQKQFDLNIDWVEPQKIEALAPGLNQAGLRGGTYSPEDGSANPLKVVDAYYQLARREQVSFHFHEKVTGFSTTNQKIDRVKTPRGEYAVDLVINAAGAYARAVGALLGIEVPVQPDSHEGGITEPVQRFFEPMIVDLRANARSENYYFYQNAEGQVIFCITPEPKIPGTDCDNTSEFLPLVCRRMIDLYPRLRNLRVRRTWRGLYPMSPDGFPIVGAVKGAENFYLAVGMCGQGFMIGPGLGEILAEVIVDQTDQYDKILTQLSLYRDFTGDEQLK